MVSVHVEIFHQRRAQCFLWNRYRQMILFTSILCPPLHVASCATNQVLWCINTTLDKLITTQGLFLLHHPGTKNHALFTFSVQWFGKSKCTMEKKLHFFHWANKKKTPVNLESVKCNKNETNTTITEEAFNLSRDVSQKGIVFFDISFIQGHEGKFNTSPHTILCVLCIQWCRRQSPHINNPQAIVFTPGTGTLYYTTFR